MVRVPDPLHLLGDLFEEAVEREPFDATAVALATADSEGTPSVRMVLLKRVDGDGIVFYTNYRSRKARQLEENPRGAVCCWWPTLEWQVRLEGSVRRVKEEESDAYFASRPRDSQLGAWASRQSEPLPSRFTLLRRFLEAKARFLGRSVPRPPFWGGYRLAPDRMEFWSLRRHRLHERRLYEREGEGWRSTLLYP